LAGGSIPPVGTRPLFALTTLAAYVFPTMNQGSRPGAQRAARRTPVGLEQRLLARARAARLARGSRIIVGFSGGRDSLALATALRWVAAADGIELVLVHVDHRLRESSAAEAVRAVALATSLGLGCRVERVDTWPASVTAGTGIEAAARAARYRTLGNVAVELGAAVVATAHHETDQAETVLMHLLRGAGMHGAAGMAEWSPLPVRDISLEFNPVSLWRPFLREPRTVIDAYVATLGVVPIDDPSNDDRSLRRNAVRHELLPELEALEPGAVASLARFGFLAAEDDLVLDALANEHLVAAVDPGGRLAAAPVRVLPLALQRRVARLWLTERGPRELSAERSDAVVALALAGRGREIEIGEGWTVRLEHGMLRAERGPGAGDGRSG
jgi:tRNA(Ile)-lysidine synthetase-like protein